MSTIAAAMDKSEVTRPPSRKSSTTNTSARPQNGPEIANHVSATPTTNSAVVTNSAHPNSTSNSTPTHTNGRSSTSTSGRAASGRRPWRDQPNIGKYKLIRTLGRGNFAKVKLAEHVSTGRQVAVKVIDKTQLNRASLLKLFREVKIMKMLNHPNIVRLYEVIESERHVYLVMEYASNGEVFDYLVTNGRMKEKEARAKFRQLVSAVEYCHWKKIVHRDLKAENLLLDKDFNIKLADFGFSNFYDGENKLDTFCGSPPYAAPELFQGQKYYGPEVDVWSLGVILYTLVSGSLPFDAQHLKELQSRVIRGKYRVPFYMSTDCELLLRKLLVLNPSKRKPLKTIMSDKWLNIGYEDNILEPYVEPPPDYNDPTRLAIMQKMGYQPEEVREALENQSFNNVTAIYLLLADPKTQQTLPAQSFVRSAKESKSDTAANAPTRKSSVLEDAEQSAQNLHVLTDDSAPTRTTKTPNPEKNSSALKVDTPSTNNGDRKSGAGVSWLKQSSSAGPTSSRVDRPTNDNVSSGLPHVQLVDNSGNEGPVTSAQPNDGDETSVMTTDAAWIRRNNTFTVKKMRPSGSDLTPPDQSCPLSRAPQFSDIPNHLTSETDPIVAAATAAASTAAESTEPRVGEPQEKNETEDSTLKAAEPITTPKTTVATPYHRDNPFIEWLRRMFSCHRPRSKPGNAAVTTDAVPDKAPVVRVDSNLAPAVVDMLNPEARHQFSRNCPERATVAVASRRPGLGATKHLAVPKPLNPIEANDSTSSASTMSQADTLNGSSSNTLNSDSTRMRTNTPQTPIKQEGVSTPGTQPNSSSASTTENRNLPRFKLPTTTISPGTRDPMTQWSMRLRAPVQSDESPSPLTCESRQPPAHSSTDQPSAAVDEAGTSAASRHDDGPPLTTAKPYAPSPTKPAQFFRRLTSRLSRSFRRPRHTHGRADEANRLGDPDTRAHEPGSVRTAANSKPAGSETGRVGSVGELANPVDPWTARQRQRQRRPKSSAAGNTGSARALRADSHSGGSEAQNGYHGDSADDATLTLREKDPFMPRLQEPRSSGFPSLLTGSLGRSKLPGSDVEPMRATLDSKSVPGKPAKPRRLLFVYRLHVHGRDPNVLLRETLRVLDQNSISYVHVNDYCLSCTNQPYATHASGTLDGGRDEQRQRQHHQSQREEDKDRLLHSEPLNAATVLKWEMEVCRLLGNPSRYGVKFKRVSGDSDAFKKLEQTLTRQFTVPAD